MIKAVVFDLDDTLYDQFYPFKSALTETFPDLMPTLDAMQAFNVYRQSSAAAYAKVDQGRWTRDEMAQNRVNLMLQKQAVPPVTMAEALDFQVYYCANLEEITLFPGFRTAFDELSHQFELGIITNGRTEHQLKKIMQLDLPRWFKRENVLTSEEAGIGKPNPEIFTMMNRRLGLRASEMAYVGDCYSADILGAKRAGWRSCWFNHRQFEELDSSLIPDQTVADDQDLFNLLLALASSNTEEPA
ncbi:HAD family hydrolase [Levilactobacillus bambusae]|uniref:HAD family hydrolase n=1 Tax=Levilactobacillus bambusae TaxID=2024736 RepID=A0A2V1N4H2_9LACO|nr:HAD family hydrolase [Levilactobacillus bambusae]PWG00720.1 HAD family hydrolase [Levilactobacillus bambusae]